MKEIIICSILFIAIFSNCAFSDDNTLKGVWELVEGKNVSADTTTTFFPTTPFAKHMKIISKTHFTTVWQDTSVSNFWTEGFNGGTYTFINGIYTEHLTYFSWVESIGIKVSFKVKIEGDKLFLSPANEDGTEKEFGLFEQWKKLE